MSFKKFPFAFLFCFLLIFLRAKARVFHAEIWAEDGVVFLKEALEHGWRSLFFPATGYFHVIQRAGLLLQLNWLPLEYLAAGIALFSMTIQAFVISRWASYEYEWILSHPVSRWLLCWVLCLGPGLNEMVGTLCNINWFLTLWLAQLLLKDPKVPIKKREWLFLVPVLLSIGTGALLFPLAIWRYGKKPRSLTLVLTIFFIYSLVLIFIRDPAHTQAPQIEIGEWLRTYFRHFKVSVLLQPLLGDRVSVFLSHGKAVQWGGFLSYTFLFTALTWAFRNRKNPAVQAICIFVLSFSTWLFLVWIGRTSSISYFQQPLFESFFAHRYSFPMTWPACLFWFLILDFIFKKASYPFWIFAIWVALTASYRFLIPAHSLEGRWMALAKELSRARETGFPKKMRVKVFPGEAFDFEFVSKELTAPSP